MATKYSYEDLKDVINEIVLAFKMLGENLNVKIPMTVIKERVWIK